MQRAFGVVIGTPLSSPIEAVRNADVTGQSTPGSSGVAIVPAPYSPVSK